MQMKCKGELKGFLKEREAFVICGGGYALVFKYIAVIRTSMVQEICTKISSRRNIF